MYKKILVPLDGSELAESALIHAIELANAFHAEVYLLQVVMHLSGTLAPYDIDYQFSETMRERAVSEAHDYVNRVKNTYNEQLKGGTFHVKVIEGIVVDTILDYAEFVQTDLIVMATHGRSGVSRWVFGSVAERVLRAAPCPVFLVRTVEVHEKKIEA